jgi:hypothetical protein
MYYNKIKYSIPFLFFIALVLTGCSDVKSSYKNLNISFTCMAFNCHAGTQLRIMLPVSGAHSTHLSADQIGSNLSCESCHSDYTNDRAGMHQDGFVNGFNWLYNAKAPGLIVKAGNGYSFTFDQTASTCSGTASSCHGLGTPNWYSGSSCSSCHVNPPLSKYPPISGAHEVHRYNNFSCQNCHFRYIALPTHNNGIVNGYIWQSRTKVTGVDIVILGAAAGTGASFSPTTSDCTSINCHVTRNWYSYTDGCSSCHRFPPLNQSTPTSGLHGLHQNRSIDCQVCHDNYAASNPLHNNGTIEGSALDPKATVFGNIVKFSVSGTWSPSTQNCSGLPGGQCHGTENWYTGGD